MLETSRPPPDSMAAAADISGSERAISQRWYPPRPYLMWLSCANASSRDKVPVAAVRMSVWTATSLV